jgi:hypothetical protein
VLIISSRRQLENAKGKKYERPSGAVEAESAERTLEIEQGHD